MISYLMQQLFKHLAFTYLFSKLETEFTKFEWDLSYSMICLDLLTTGHYCNHMTWYHVISAWMVKGDRYTQDLREIQSIIVLFTPLLKLCIRSWMQGTNAEYTHRLSRLQENCNKMQFLHMLFWQIQALL